MIMNTNNPPADTELIRHTDNDIFIHYTYVTHKGNTDWASVRAKKALTVAVAAP
mgnify:CR=1 FL=1